MLQFMNQLHNGLAVSQQNHEGCEVATLPAMICEHWYPGGTTIPTWLVNLQIHGALNVFTQQPLDISHDNTTIG